MAFLRGVFWGAVVLVALFSAPVPADVSDTVAVLRVLHLNVYGRKENDCEARFQAIADEIRNADPPYDIVSFNEHWYSSLSFGVACDGRVLTEAMEADGRYADVLDKQGRTKKLRSRKSHPKPEEWNEIQGGDSIFTRHEIIDWRSEKFVNTSFIPVSGALFARIKLGQGPEIDIYSTHLEAGVDDCDEECRLEQACDLGSFVDTYSGPMAPEHPDVNPVLILGDFNVGGPWTHLERGLHETDPKRTPYQGNAGYEDVMECLGRPRDLWLEKHGSLAGFLRHGAATMDCSLNSIKRSEGCRYRERIDYMIAPGWGIFGQETKYKVQVDSIEITRWKVPGTRDDVSDHFGLDATVRLVRRPERR